MSVGEKDMGAWEKSYAERRIEKILVRSGEFLYRHLTE